MFPKTKNSEIFVSVKREMIGDKLLLCDRLSLVPAGVSACAYKRIITAVNLSLWDAINDEAVILQVFAIVCVSKPGDLDAISFDLPIMKKMGDKVHITCKSLRQADDWIKEVRRETYNAISLPDHCK